MDGYDFSHWLDHHIACFTRVAETFSKMDPELREKTRDAWQSVLRHTSLDDAKEATDRLFRSDERSPVFEKHPVAVRRHASEIRREREWRERRRHYARTGEGTVACPVCQDTGYETTSVLETNLADRAATMYGEKAARVTAARVCSCRARKP